MAYTKTNWVARVGTALNRFLKTNETTTSVELTNDPTGVSVAGTPFTVDNMNKIETGIYDAHEALDANGISLATPRIDQGVKTTDDVTFASVNSNLTIHNANETVFADGYADATGQLYVNYDGGVAGKPITNYNFNDGQGAGVKAGITVATVNTGQGDNELYRMSHEVLAFGSVYDETKTEYISAMISGEVRFVNITASLTGSGSVTVKIEVKLPSVGTYDVIGLGGALAAESLVFSTQTVASPSTVNACILVRRV